MLQNLSEILTNFSVFNLSQRQALRFWIEYLRQFLVLDILCQQDGKESTSGISLAECVQDIRFY